MILCPEYTKSWVDSPIPIDEYKYAQFNLYEVDFNNALLVSSFPNKSLEADKLTITLAPANTWEELGVLTAQTSSHNSTATFNFVWYLFEKINLVPKGIIFPFKIIEVFSPLYSTKCLPS